MAVIFLILVGLYDEHNFPWLNAALEGFLVYDLVSVHLFVCYTIVYTYLSDVCLEGYIVAKKEFPHGLSIST